MERQKTIEGTQPLPSLVAVWSSCSFLFPFVSVRPESMLPSPAVCSKLRFEAESLGG